MQVDPWHVLAMHASPEGHEEHAFPPVPQSLTVVPTWHVPLASQHPLGQVIALHVDAWQSPALHASLGGHAAQLSPPTPH